MKKRLLQTSLALAFLGIVPAGSAQVTPSFDTEFAPIDNELSQWDGVRGKWLSSSLKAMSVDQPIPDRTFPEDFSPAEMLRMVPTTTLEKVRTISQNQSQNSRDLLARDRWARIYNYTNRPSCQLVMGRTYGDPHLKSFDGSTYSFQTVGEFQLASANNGQFEVQVRQEPQSDDFSLNTAVAMKVGNDRVGIYARDKRDAFSAPVMLNGMPIEVGNRTYYLPHGGTIRNSGKNYLVTWPTGESVSVDLDRTGSMSFMNVAVQVYPCASNSFNGLLGNANGNRNDDFNTNGNSAMSSVFSSGSSMSQEMEKERLAFLAKDFANAFRITPQTSLFDYGFGENTLTFTDYSYPRVHRTIHDIPLDRQTIARNNCAGSGLIGDELNACMYDQAFLNIQPIRPPVIVDRTNNVSLGRVEQEVPNVNPPRVIPPTNEAPSSPGKIIHSRPVKPETQIDNRNGNDIKNPPATTKPQWESRETEERQSGNANNGNGIPRPANSPEVDPSNKQTKPEKLPTATPSRPTQQNPPKEIPAMKPATRPITPPREMPKPGSSSISKPSSPSPVQKGNSPVASPPKRGGK